MQDHASMLGAADAPKLGALATFVEELGLKAFMLHSCTVALRQARYEGLPHRIDFTRGVYTK
jgi:hypothetical protein